jgi:WD40 repeat protein
LHIISLEGKELASLPYPNQTNTSCVFSPNQRWLVSSDTSGKLVIWDTSNYEMHVVSHQLAFHAPWKATQWTPSFQHMLDISRSSAKHFLFTPDGQRLAFVSASDEGYVHICQFHPLQQHIVLQKTILLVGVEDQKIPLDGSMIAITSQGSVSVYDLESFQLQARWSGKGEALYSLVAFSPDGQFLASSTYDGSVDILSLTAGERMISFAAHPGLITHWGPVIGGLDWSQSGYIATGGTSVFKDDTSKNDYTIKLWNVKY